METPSESISSDASVRPQRGPTDQQSRILWTALTALAVTTLLGMAALVFLGFTAFLSWSYPILLPIGLAVIIALVLEPAVGFVQDRGYSRNTATLFICLLTVIGFLLFWSFLLPPLVGQSVGFFKSLPNVLSAGAASLQKNFSNQPEETPLERPPVTTNASVNPPPPAILTLTNQAPPAGGANLLLPVPEGIGERSKVQEWLTGNLPAIESALQKNVANFLYAALGPVGQAFGFLLGFGFVPIYVYYFLADRERIANHWHDYIPLRRSSFRDEVVVVLKEISTSLVGYFRGQIIVAAVNGVLTFIGLWAIGVPYSLVLGMITGALSIVPFLGIIASILPALLLAFLSAKDDPTWQWLRPVLVLGVFSLVQMSESMFITPRVQSHSTGLHPLAIILGILFWSMLLPGLLGPIVAVPLTCAGVVLLRRYVWQEKAASPPSPL